jgi:hypothetical protein
MFCLEQNVGLFFQYLEEVLGDGFVFNKCNQSAESIDNDQLLAGVIFAHKQTQYLFELRLFYGGSIKFRCLGMTDGVLWTPPEWRMSSENTSKSFHHYDQDAVVTPYPMSTWKWKYIVVPEDSIDYDLCCTKSSAPSEYLFAGYFLEELEINDLKSILDEIKEFTNTGIFRQYSLYDYTPFFNPKCALLTFCDFREYLDMLSKKARFANV